jgi:hypothetical protein
MAKTGFFKGVVKCVSPSKEWIENIIGEEIGEPIYTGTTKDVRWSNLDFYIEDNKENIFKYTIHLKDRERCSKSGVFQYINCIGDTQWGKEEDLWDSFKQFEKVLTWVKDGKSSDRYFSGAKPGEKDIIGEKKYKIAWDGEEELLHLLRVVDNITPYNPDVNLFLDLNKLFEGDFTELQRAIKNDRDFHFTALAYVNEQFEQRIFKKFMPENFIRDVLSENISNYNKKAYNDLVNATEYVPGHYSFGRLIDFNINTVKTITEDGSDY